MCLQKKDIAEFENLITLLQKIQNSHHVKLEKQLRFLRSGNVKTENLKETVADLQGSLEDYVSDIINFVNETQLSSLRIFREVLGKEL